MTSNSEKKLKPEDIYTSNASINSITKKTDVYDVINSEDLDLLYKKNAQLLSRLSSTGRQNGILQTEVCSLLEEKSRLDVKNNFLKTKVDSLKGQISLFARQQRNFNEQSLRLKKELKGLKVNGFKLINERSDIIKNQTANQKLAHYMNYRERVKEAHKKIKNQIYKVNSLIQEKESEILLLTKKEMVYVNQIKNLEKQYFESKKIQENQEKNLSQLKAGMESENNKKQHFSQKEEDLHNLVQILKHQQEDLLKENESYENQLHLYQFYQQENQTLSENYSHLRTIVSQQEEGFNQTLMSFRKKYMKIHKELKSKSKEVEMNSAEVLRFKNLLEQNQKNFEIEKENLRKTLNSEKQNEIHTLTTELNIKNKSGQDIAQQLQNLKSKQKQELAKLQNTYLDEIQSLKLKLELQSSKFNEVKERSIQNVKNEYESRINNLDISYKKRLQHIRTEMENDFLNERRRSEIFKSMKEKQMKEIETHLEQLQQETHRLKTSHFALENSNREMTLRMKKEISKNEYLITQNKNLHSLWHQIQQSLEKKEQQIQSLQKLNKNLSVSFNETHSKKTQKKEEVNSLSFKNTSSTKDLTFVSPSSEKKDSIEDSSSTTKANDILAGIHFD